MLYYRFHGFPVDSDAPVGATFARITECLATAGVADAPVRFCLHGRGCADIMAKFPELRQSLTTFRAQHRATPTQYLSNYGLEWPGAFAGPPGDVDVATIAAIMNGIPAEFPIHMVSLLFGPIRKDAAVTMPPLEGAPFRLQRYHGIHLSWQSSPANDGRRYFMSVHEPLLSSNPKQPVAPWIRTLRAAFPGAAFEKNQLRNRSHDDRLPDDSHDVRWQVHQPQGDWRYATAV